MWFDSFRAGFYATYISLYFFAPPCLSLNGIISTRIKRLAREGREAEAAAEKPKPKKPKPKPKPPKKKTSILPAHSEWQAEGHTLTSGTQQHEQRHRHRTPPAKRRRGVLPR